MFSIKRIFAVGCGMWLFVSGVAVAHAQSELVPDQTTLMKARVLSIEKEETKEIPGTDTQTTFQTIGVEILDGVEKGSASRLIMTI